MTKKKIIITVVVLVVIASIIGGSIYGYQEYQKNNLVADVESVADLNTPNWEGGASSYGYVTNDDAQNVYLLEQQAVEDVHVEEGQEVKIGDPLISYDMTANDLKLEMQELNIQTIENNIILAQRELEKLKNTKPVSKDIEVPEPEPQPEPQPNPEPNIPEKTGDAYQYISKTALSYAGEGTQENPFRFLCTQDCYVLGSWLNILSEMEEVAFFRLEIRENNKEKGTLITSWDIYNRGITPVDDDSRWSVMTKQEIEEPDQSTDIEDEYEDTGTEDIEIEEGYTAEELQKMIREKDMELKEENLDLRKAKLELNDMKRLADSGVESAKINGIVKSVGDISDSNNDGSPFIVISGSEGLYVKGSLSELLLDEVEIGQVVYANSWETGSSFEATIESISEYPTEDTGWGEGNPNVTYYPYIAYIENSEGLSNGEGVELSMSSNSSIGSADPNDIYLPKAYLREENGKYYVFKADETNHLKKQYVKTGKYLYGEAIQILSGITVEDKIAFPYGKLAKEGTKVNTNTSDSMEPDDTMETPDYDDMEIM